MFELDPGLHPARPGVYLFRDSAEKVLYVGKARNLRQRLRSYAAGGDGRVTIRLMLKRAASVECLLTDTEVEALLLENNLIKQHAPRYNVLLKDDKSYPYVRVTSEPFPRVLVTRKRINDGSRYFGPFTEVRYLRGFLRSLRETLCIRECSLVINEDSIAAQKHQVCLDYHMGKCLGPCAGLQQSQDYSRSIDATIQLLKGRTEDWRRSEEAAMQAASDALDFEQAARHRDALKGIGQLSHGQKVDGRPGGAVDVVALARTDNRACGVLLRVREGRLLGRFHNHFRGSLEHPEEAQLRAFMLEYYTHCEELPDEIWLSGKPEEQELLEEWLEKKAATEGSRRRKLRIRIPQKGKGRDLMDMALRNARSLLEEAELRSMKRDRVPESLKALARDLGLPKLPRRIEGFDISHFGGESTVASLVVFQDGRPSKKHYRHFRIRTVDGIDDFASMEEVVQRRYSRLVAAESELPDLILIDGGKGQLGRAHHVLKKLGLKNLPVLGLAKRLEEVFVPGESLPRNIPKDSASNRLLQHVRNEAHRFAIQFNRKLRRKEAIPDPLASVRGLGPAVRDRLLQRFGDLRALSECTESELLEVAGMGPVLAERLLAFLKQTKAASS